MQTIHGGGFTTPNTERVVFVSQTQRLGTCRREAISLAKPTRSLLRITIRTASEAP